MNWWGTAVLLASLVSQSGSVRAEPAGETTQEGQRRAATELLRAGAKLLEDKEPAQALDKFNEAFALVRSPRIHFNIALALTALDRPAAALRALEQYLREAGGDRAARRDEATRRARVLRSKVVTVHLKADLDGAIVFLDGVELGKTPLAGPLIADPGPHGLTVQAAGRRPWVRSIQGEAGATVELTATVGDVSDLATVTPVPAGDPQPAALAAVPVADVTSDPHTIAQGSRHKPWLWVAVGVGVAAITTGIILGVSASRKTEFTCPTTDCIRAR